MNNSETAKSIAVIGAGVAGIVAAHLLSRKHRVTLIESNSYVGGHTNTIDTFNEDRALVRVDTGFIVLNDKTYPTFHRFLAALGVEVRFSDMSFGYECKTTGLKYSGHNLLTLFAQPKNLLSPVYLKFLNDIKRFCKLGQHLLPQLGPDTTVREFCREHQLNEFFQRHYLIPMAAAIWSAPDEGIRDFPIKTLLLFFRNHGLLSLNDRPRWQTVIGGSKSYVESFLKSFNGKVLTNSPVSSVCETEQSVNVRLMEGRELSFDAVVLALHADLALKVLENPSNLQKRLLKPWSYQRNKTFLHDDPSFLPSNRLARASWNYRRTESLAQKDAVFVTYDMNRLQGFKCKRNFLVTLNPVEPIDDANIIQEFNYDHPVFDTSSVQTQPELDKLNQEGRIQFCGSYFGYGFHEDAVASAAKIGALWGETL
ncbi:MAG: FAD-dependent oxidoreductase [Bdellovibrionales bacterium]|nr:FAD-dependent oxidoreductase [Bdellovibrionales bacterium]